MVKIPSEGGVRATVSVAQAKSQFAALVARAEAGERIVVTRSGRAANGERSMPRGRVTSAPSAFGRSRS